MESLWGEPERVHVRAERGAVACVCHQNVSETQATEYPKSTHREL